MINIFYDKNGSEDIIQPKTAILIYVTTYMDCENILLNTPETEGQIVYDSIYMRYLE